MQLSVRWPKLLLFVMGAMIFSAPAIAQQGARISAAEAEAIAIDAYIYGYPLVTMEMTRRVMTNVAAPTDRNAPMGQFFNMKTYPDPTFTDVTTPNADTLYSTAWLDLSKEPYILHVPNEEERYYLMPMLSGWTDVFASPGTRTTGTQEENFAIVGPNWTGTLPPEVKILKSPTNIVWIIGRTYSSGTPEDYAAVHKLQEQYTLTPLSAFGKTYKPPKGHVDASIDMKTPVRDQVNKLDPATFFNTLALLMKENPPSQKDSPILARMAKIGIVPGQQFDISKLDSATAQAIQQAPKKALEKITAHEPQAGRKENGWLVTTKTGQYGTDYLQRAFVTLVGLGANLPEDAVYPGAHVDSSGQPLDGANKYVIHFPKGQLPPTRAFWSLTMYNDKLFFVANPLNRYTLSPRNNLKYNPDGSLDLYIQQASPGPEKEANWLPAPKGKFNLTLRIYWPEKSVIDGTWKPPAIKKM